MLPIVLGLFIAMIGIFTEKRLTRHNSYTGRFVDELTDYNVTNPVEALAMGNMIFWKGFGLEPGAMDAGNTL